MDNEEFFWEEYKSPIRSFSYDEYVMHIVPTGHNKGDEYYYIVVHDDAHEVDTGLTELLTPSEIFDKYKIEI